MYIRYIELFNLHFQMAVTVVYVTADISIL